MNTALKPTDEQTEAIRLALTGEHLAIEAGAGTGKSATLKMIADAKRGQNGTYWVFNRAMAEEARTRFPPSVKCTTSHSYAYATHGRPIKARLDAPRMRSSDVASRLGIGPINYAGIDGPKRAAGGFLAGYVMAGVNRYCQTSDEKPSWRHIPTPEAMRDDRELFRSWEDVRRHLEPFMHDAWRDLSNPTGSLNVTHDVYRKLWALSHPRIPSDYLLVDEFQDTAEVLLGVVEEQRDHAQVIGVGDSNQQLYSWANAVDALSKFKTELRCRLSMSFRFGPEIAAEANAVLAMLPTDMRLIGGGGPGRIGPVEFPDVVLSRTNAIAVKELFAEIDRGGKPHIVGGAKDVLGFVRGAKKLMESGWTEHAELVCFGSWDEVRSYASDDIMGSDLKMMVKLVDEYTPDRIIAALEHMPSQSYASLILSTGHKSKGLQFGSVRLAEDFPDGDPDKPSPDDETVRLLYVGITRAQRECDVESVGLLRPKARADTSTALFG